MEIVIEWSEQSEIQLKDIFDYYSFKVNSVVASKIVSRIIDRVSILATNPLAGTKEELLSNHVADFRYLVESNYKIIYWKSECVVTIASVFDCRQNPVKIKNVDSIS